MICRVLIATTNGLYLGNFRDFCDFRDFRLSDTSFLIKNGLFFLKRKIPKFFSYLFYTQSTPRFQSSKRNFQNQPCMTPSKYRLTQFFILLFLKYLRYCQPVAFMPNFSSFGIFTQIQWLFATFYPIFYLLLIINCKTKKNLYLVLF